MRYCECAQKKKPLENCNSLVVERCSYYGTY
nr:MAG TPA: hypothetical protein [Caudoviricetes sp.]